MPFRNKNKRIIPDRLFRWALRLAYALYLVFGFVFRPRHRGVGVAVWHGGGLLLIRNAYRRAVSVPAGGLGHGESRRAAAVRELHEEVGIRLPPQRLRPAGRFYDTSEFFRDEFTLFEVFLDKAPLIRIDRREVVWAGFMAPGQALEQRLMPPVRAYLEGLATSPTNGWKHFDPPL